MHRRGSRRDTKNRESSQVERVEKKGGDKNRAEVPSSSAEYTKQAISSIWRCAARSAVDVAFAMSELLVEGAKERSVSLQKRRKDDKRDLQLELMVILVT